MSVQKPDSAKIRQEKIPFTQHLNYVLQHLCDPIALAIWCYLTSLPEDWEVHRTQLMEHFNIGRDKLGSALKFLNDNMLIEYVVDKNEKGKIEAWHIMVKAGHEFEVIHRSRSTLLNSTRVENQCSGKQHLQKKEDTNKDFKKKSFCANAQKKPKSEWRKENVKFHDFAESMNNKAESKTQMNNEAKHIQEHEARKEEFKRAAMPDSLRAIVKNMKVANGGANHDNTTDGRRMQKDAV